MRHGGGEKTPISKKAKGTGRKRKSQDNDNESDDDDENYEVSVTELVKIAAREERKITKGAAAKRTKMNQLQCIYIQYNNITEILKYVWLALQGRNYLSSSNLSLSVNLTNIIPHYLRV